MLADKQFSIEQMQRWLQDALVFPGKSAELVHGEIPTEEIINASQKLTAQRHLNIYRQSYIARLRECMKNQFSGLAYALGEELFQAFADDYLLAHPSESYTLNDLGKKFPDFLEATRPDANEEEKESWPDFMIELARFEFDLSAIFDENAEELNKPVPPNVTDEELKLIPVFHLFHHRFPVCKYYMDFAAKKEPQLPFEEETYCVVLRKNYRLGLFVINPAQFIFLSSLKEGHTLQEALTKTGDAFQFDAAKKNEVWKEWRKNFLSSGFFASRD